MAGLDPWMRNVVRTIQQELELYRFNMLKRLKGAYEYI